MSKSRDAFRTISEVAELLDTPAHVLRFWESKFTQVKPVKRAGGRRYYRPGEIAALAGIKKLLHEDGLTIQGVRKVLREQGVKHVATLVPLPIDADAEKIEDAPFAEVAPETATVLPFAPAESDAGEPEPQQTLFPADAPEAEDAAAALPDFLSHSLEARREDPLPEQDAAPTEAPEDDNAPAQAPESEAPAEVEETPESADVFADSADAPDDESSTGGDLDNAEDDAEAALAAAPLAEPEPLADPEPDEESFAPAELESPPADLPVVDTDNSQDTESLETDALPAEPEPQAPEPEPQAAPEPEPQEPAEPAPEPDPAPLADADSAQPEPEPAPQAPPAVIPDIPEAGDMPGGVAGMLSHLAGIDRLSAEQSQRIAPHLAALRQWLDGQDDHGRT